MAEKITVKDWTGKIIGFIDVEKNGAKTVRNFHGKILGKYDPRFNITQDFHGRRIAQGDQSSMLFSMFPDK